MPVDWGVVRRWQAGVKDGADARKDGLTRSLFEVNDQTDVQDSGAKLKGDTLPDSLGALEDAEYSASIANRTASWTLHKS